MHEHICKLEAQIDQDRQQIEKFRARLPGFFQALEEWRNQSDKAVQKAMDESLDLLLGGLLALGADQAQTAAKFSRSQSDNLKKIWFPKSPIYDSLKKAMGAEAAKELVKAGKFETVRDLYQVASAIQNSVQLGTLTKSDADMVEKMIKGALKSLDVVASLPQYADQLENVGKGLQVVGLADYTINYAYAATAYATSWARINQLRDTTLHAEAQALADVHKKHVDEHQALVKTRLALIGPDITFPCSPEIA